MNKYTNIATSKLEKQVAKKGYTEDIEVLLTRYLETGQITEFQNLSIKIIAEKDKYSKQDKTIINRIEGKYYYVLGLLEKKKNLKEKESINYMIDCLERAINFDNSDASFELARFYEEQQDNIEAITYYIKALQMGSPSAIANYLNNKIALLHSINARAYHIIAFLAVQEQSHFVPSSKRFINKYSISIASNDVSREYDIFFTKPNVKTFYSMLNENNKFYKFMRYAHGQKVISDDFYQNYLQHMLKLSWLRDYDKEKIVKRLIEIKIVNGNLAEAQRLLKQLHPRVMANNPQFFNNICYQSFNESLAKNDLQTAMRQFNGLSANFAGHDNDTLIFLTQLISINHRDTKAFVETAVNKILAVYNKDDNKEGRDLYTFASNFKRSFQDISSNFSTVADSLKIDLDNYLIERQIRVKKNPLRFFLGDYIFGNKEWREQYIKKVNITLKNLKSYIKNPYLVDEQDVSGYQLNRNAYQRAITELITVINEGQQQFIPGWFSGDLYKILATAKQELIVLDASIKASIASTKTIHSMLPAIKPDNSLVNKKNYQQDLYKTNLQPVNINEKTDSVGMAATQPSNLVEDEIEAMSWKVNCARP